MKKQAITKKFIEKAIASRVNKLEGSVARASETRSIPKGYYAAKDATGKQLNRMQNSLNVKAKDLQEKGKWEESSKVIDKMQNLGFGNHVKNLYKKTDKIEKKYLAKQAMPSNFAQRFLQAKGMKAMERAAKKHQARINEPTWVKEFKRETKLKRKIDPDRYDYNYGPVGYKKASKKTKDIDTFEYALKQQVGSFNINAAKNKSPYKSRIYRDSELGPVIEVFDSKKKKVVSAFKPVKNTKEGKKEPYLLFKELEMKKEAKAPSLKTFDSAVSKLISMSKKDPNRAKLMKKVDSIAPEVMSKNPKATQTFLKLRDSLIKTSKAESKSQQRLMGMVHAYQNGNLDNFSELPIGLQKKIKDMAKSMSSKQTQDYAETKHKGLKEKVAEKYTDKQQDEAYRAWMKDRPLKEKVVSNAALFGSVLLGGALGGYTGLKMSPKRFKDLGFGAGLTTGSIAGAIPGAIGTAMYDTKKSRKAGFEYGDKPDESGFLPVKKIPEKYLKKEAISSKAMGRALKNRLEKVEKLKNQGSTQEANELARKTYAQGENMISIQKKRLNQIQAKERYYTKQRAISEAKNRFNPN